jgi:uncharacterized protein YacL
MVVRQRRLLLRIVRIGFTVLFAVVTGLSLFGGGLAGADAAAYWPITLVIALTVAAVTIAVDLLTPRKKVSTIVGVLFGLLAAMLATAALGFVIDLLAATYGEIPSGDPRITIIKILIGTGMAYLAIATVLQTQDDFRLVIPYVEFAKQLRGPRPLLLDSSALIDARFADLAETGILQAPVIIPRFVIDELQLLADSDDKPRRSKGRRGLDLIGRLQRSAHVDVTVDETPVPGKAVDQMLVELARRTPGMIVTTDTALARIAAIHSVPVVNVHDLAAALRPSFVAGEPLRLRVLKPGEQPGQGVGYLDDGTMVVVEDGEPLIGQTVELTVTSTLQTSAGRLVFARHGPAEPRRREDDERPEPRTPFPPKPPARRDASPRNPRR